MRQIRTVQSSIFDLFADHEIGRELHQMSDWLDQHFELSQQVAQDLGHGKAQDTGSQGLPAESVLRCALLKQYRQLSYTELAFHLLDSASFQAFARLPAGYLPRKSSLQQTISSIKATTWDSINQSLLKEAMGEKMENAKQVRLDSTVTATDIHPPTDNSLLWDCVRMMVRQIEKGFELSLVPLTLDWVNHSRAAKKRAHEIRYVKGDKKRRQLYKNLLMVTRKTQRYLRQVKQQLTRQPCSADQQNWLDTYAHNQPLIETIIEQAQRRALQGEKVPANEKLFSLFEAHTDIIVKGSRDIQYGHKLNLTSGKSGLILDLVIESGNPADSDQLLPMLDRHISIYGRAPRQMAADGGYASKDNLKQAKARGVKDMAFHKKRGMLIEQMVKSHWVYRKLRNFRAGIEAGISALKRAYGLKRCNWKGLEHFKSYVWSSVVAYNMMLFARLKLA